jgi:hypothetical protein
VAGSVAGVVSPPERQNAKAAKRLHRLNPDDGDVPQDGYCR